MLKLKLLILCSLSLLISGCMSTSNQNNPLLLVVDFASEQRGFNNIHEVQKELVNKDVFAVHSGKETHLHHIRSNADAFNISLNGKLKAQYFLPVNSAKGPGAAYFFDSNAIALDDALGMVKAMEGVDDSENPVVLEDLEQNKTSISDVDIANLSSGNILSSQSNENAVKQETQKNTFQNAKQKDVMPTRASVFNGSLKANVERLAQQYEITKVVWSRTVPSCADWEVTSFEIPANNKFDVFGYLLSPYGLLPKFHQVDGYLEIISTRELRGCSNE